jgi:hypothetical protein
MKYEPWMVDGNGQGVAFDADDELASMHPEIWLLSPEPIEEIRSMERGNDMRKNQAAIIETTSKKWQR